MISISSLMIQLRRHRKSRTLCERLLPALSLFCFWYGLTGWSAVVRAAEVVEPSPLCGLSVVAPASVYSNTEFTVSLEYSSGCGTVTDAEWWLDGTVISAARGEVTVPLTIPRIGKYRLLVRSAMHGQATTYEFMVRAPVVRLQQLLPNPVGSDTNQERVILVNKEPISVLLKDWRLQSRTTSTSVRINGAIMAEGTLEVGLSNKLSNSGGTYDLYNGSGELVDTVRYAKAPEGGLLTRAGYPWQFSNHEVTPATEVNRAVPERTVVQGVVHAPQGRRFTIVTDSEEVIRVVVHASVPERPRLRRGYRVEVSGAWRRSRSGPYLSVRGSDLFRVVTTILPEPDRGVTPARRPSRRHAPLEATSDPAEPISGVNEAIQLVTIEKHKVVPRASVSAARVRWRISAAVAATLVGCILVLFREKPRIMNS